jgi:hypothetical protein
MPFLDVSDITCDPDFADRFTVVRRQETVDGFGRAGVTERLFHKVVGVVTMSSPNDLDRREDYQNFTRSITVVTKFAVQGAVIGYQPDLIEWRGTRHLVKHVAPYPQFGKGFYQVECSSMTNMDNPV